MFPSYKKADPMSKLCEICEKPGAAVRYKKYACNACRVFFSRAVQDNMAVSCYGDDNCKIHFANYKKNCYACRLKKCHNLGMAASEVGRKGNSYDRVVPRFTAHEWNTAMNRSVKNSLDNSRKSTINIRVKNRSLFNYVEEIRERESVLFSGVPPSLLTLNQALRAPGSCIPNYVSLLDYLNQSAFEARGNFKGLESTCRVIIACAELMCLVEEFKAMNTVDKNKIILQNSRSFAVLFPFTVMCTTGEKNQNLFYYDCCFFVESSLKSICTDTTSNMVKAMLAKLRDELTEINLTTHELQIIRLLVLFNPDGVNLSGEGYTFAIYAKHRLTYLLGQFISEVGMRSGIVHVTAVITTRVAKFLQILTFVHEISSLMFPISIGDPVKDNVIRTSSGAYLS